MMIIENNCINDESVSHNVLFLSNCLGCLEIKTQISENETHVLERKWKERERENNKNAEFALTETYSSPYIFQIKKNHDLIKTNQNRWRTHIFYVLCPLRAL